MQILALTSMIASMHALPIATEAQGVHQLTVEGPAMALTAPMPSASRDASGDTSDAKKVGAGNAAPANTLASSTAKSAATPKFGAKDSWRWQMLGSWIGDFKGANQLEGEWSASWFFMENVSMDFGFSGDAILQPGLDAGGGGGSLMFRWHFIAKENFSVYADLGCGMLFTNEPVPDNGGKVNFTPRAGFGATYALTDSMRLMVGARWFHISNANTQQQNPGRDSLQLYGGVSLPF